MAPPAGRRPTGAVVLATWVCLLGGCEAHRPPTRSSPPVLPTDNESSTSVPPIPLTSPEPHAEPDLVGVVHVVKKGETLYRIAKTYGVDLMDVMEINDISDPRAIEPGQELFIPGASRLLEVPSPVPSPASPGAVREPEPEPRPLLPKVTAPREGKLIWPARGVLYRRFGVIRGERHDGVDIAAPEGTPIIAANSGIVVYAGRQSGYGNIVIIKHPGGLVTLYAHASAILVKEGDRVQAGTLIARMGQSGRTTGPHLHFEVREGTRPRNPLFYLP